ncbi:hypothetical protein K440DRAFT_260946 [Wilcoxina mikolae CBS 423.85]|nr:hypothetical protein K440DRAFT_260946 [Wilcoxina mikolae CBS 423.85]
MARTNIKYFPTRVVPDSLFDSELFNAYSRDYNVTLRNLGGLQPKVHYRTRVTATSRETGLPIVFEPGRWVKLRQHVLPRGRIGTSEGFRYVKIKAIFTHARLRELRVFFIVRFGTPSGFDPIVQCNTYSYSEYPDYNIVGLPLIYPNLEHFLPVRGRTTM